MSDHVVPNVFSSGNRRTISKTVSLDDCIGKVGHGLLHTASAEYVTDFSASRAACVDNDSTSNVVVRTLSN